MTKNRTGEQSMVDKSDEAEDFRYEAFINYRHVEPDRRWAKWLHGALETYRVPRKLVQDRGIPPRLKRVFRDEEELPASADLSTEIDSALEGSRFLIVVCSRHTPESEWVNKEVVRFRQLGRDDRILALLIDGEPSEAFPRSLREIRREIIDLQGRATEEIQEIEPLAADVRSLPSRRESSGYLRRMARLRLLACILGCPFDDLRRREQERLTRRYAMIAAISFSLLMMVTVLALYAGQQRRRAEMNLADMKRAQLERALAQVDALRRAEIGQVPFLIEGMAAFRDEIGPRLKQLAQQKDLTGKERLRVSLALLSDDPQQVDYLRDRLLDAEPTELPVIRTALLPHSKALAKEMWSLVDDPQSPKERRFRAACALAAFDPEGAGWAQASRPTADVLVRENPLYVAAWMEALRPAGQKLLPSLQKIFEDAKRSDSERSVATGILADYASGEPAVLAALIPSADPKQFAVLLPVLQTHGSKAATLLEAELARQPAADATEEDRDKLGNRQANAAAALLRLNATEKAWPVFRHRLDPTARSYLIHRLGPLGVDPKLIIARLDQEQDVSARRALLLTLGEYGEDVLPATDDGNADTSPTRKRGTDPNPTRERGNSDATREPGSGGEPPSLARRASVSRERLVPKLLDLYRDDPDAGVHGAAEWVLRRWKQHARLKELDQQLATGKPQGKNQWYINGQGQTMVLILGPVEFLMGSPTTETERDRDETLHRRQIGRSFAIAAKEVTRAQYERFLKVNPEIFRRFGIEWKDRYYPDPECTHGGITWYEAAAYCNWLSEQEGLPSSQWCYEPKQAGQFVDGMKPTPDYLDRKGYRLPSEAEWEYACRSGAVTSRYYGATDRLLENYAYFQRKSSDRSWPLGSLKPNDLGLFDMLGNVFEWCHGRRFEDPTGKGEDLPDDGAVTDKQFRVLRGGSFYSLSRGERCADRYLYQPSYRNFNSGFRPARTCP